MEQQEVLNALANLTLDQLHAILGAGNGRSPIKPRQLHDLRLLPTATDPRPTFFWSAEGARDVVETHSPYPKLLWHKDTGVEITVQTEAEHRLKAADYVTVAPNSTPQSEADRIKALFDSLSPEDQKIVLDADRKARLEKIQSGLSNLSDSDRASLMAGKGKKH